LGKKEKNITCAKPHLACDGQKKERSTENAKPKGANGRVRRAMPSAFGGRKKNPSKKKKKET